MAESFLESERRIEEFFRQSAGKWKSQRRYYTLGAGKPPKEVETDITVRFLEPGADELDLLSRLHCPENRTLLTFKCGAEVTWESHYPQTGKKASAGTTIFGAMGHVLYRDCGYATDKPVTALYHFIGADTLVLNTEYDGSTFEEQIRLIGANYRTRQTIVGAGGAPSMIGQYVETRVS